jgi:P-type Ca2+ transporter type 2C
VSFWIDNPHSQSLDQICKAIRSNIAGLSTDEATKRLKEFGPNQLPIARQSTVASVFIKQFINPLIYILLLVSVISIFIGHATDAGFILVILIMNAAIGTFQAYHAERGALALRQLSTTKAIVERSGENFDIDSKDIVVGDLVHLESGVKVPADLRLISSHTLQIDESLLTGESLTVFKEYGAQIPIDTPLGDRKTMAFAGTLVTRGRGEGLVVAIASDTVLGQIAHTVMQRVSTKTPLVIRMERLTKGLAIALFFIVLAIGTMFFLHGEPLANVLILSVALGVAAIPEGLPVAITVALAIASKRMARKQVLVRNLSSVEALGSCTYIGTDKTGTLTMNELTAKAVVFPMLNPLEITGTGLTPEGKFIIPSFTPQNHIQRMIKRVSETVVLCNEGVLSMRDKKWVGHGDAVDLALLVMAHKAGVTSGKLFLNFQPVSELPFESEHKFSATLHRSSDGQVISVKGALETLLPMCSRMMILSP